MTLEELIDYAEQPTVDHTVTNVTVCVDTLLNDAIMVAKSHYVELHEEVSWMLSSPSLAPGMDLLKRGVWLAESACIPVREIGSSFSRRPTVEVQLIPTKNTYPTIPYLTTTDLISMSDEKAVHLFTGYISQLKEHPGGRTWIAYLWQSLLEANFNAFKPSVFKRAAFLHTGRVMGMVDEWFDFDAFYSYLCNDVRVTNALLMSKFIAKTMHGSHAGWPSTLYPTGMWHNETIVGPGCLDFLAPEEIHFYSHLNKEGSRSRLMRHKLLGLTTIIKPIADRDTDFYSKSLEFVEENIMTGDECNYFYPRFSKSLGELKQNEQMFIKAVAVSLRGVGKFKHTVTERGIPVKSYEYTLDDDVLSIGIAYHDVVYSDAAIIEAMRLHILAVRLATWMDVKLGDIQLHFTGITFEKQYPLSVEWTKRSFKCIKGLSFEETYVIDEPI